MMETAVDAGTILREGTRASFSVTPPDLVEILELRCIKRRLRAGGPEDHAHILIAAAIDRVPQCADLVGRHPILRIQENDSIDMACRQAFKEHAKIGMNRRDTIHAAA